MNSLSFVSVIVPSYNEENIIETTLCEIYRHLSHSEVKSEVIVVDDGSSDQTFERVQDLSKAFQNLKGLRFSRNFGKEAAIMAGLRAAQGEAVITIDADLQHPPAIIPELIAHWRAGAKIVHALKKQRKSHRPWDQILVAIFNHVLARWGGINIRNSSDFKLLDRSVVDIMVKQLHEHQRFFRGLSEWVGFRQDNVYFDLAPRNVGTSKWSVGMLADFAITGLVSFTSAPLRVVTIVGVMTLVFAIMALGDTLWSWMRGTTPSGFATIETTLLFLGSAIMISLGIMGEYIAKIYDEIKERPNYLIESIYGFDEQAQIRKIGERRRR